MRPNTMANANSASTVSVGGGGGNANANSNSAPNGITIPINHEHGHQPYQQQPGYYADASNNTYGSPRQQQPQQQIPAHFQQGFGFEPNIDMDMDMDMFPRTRLGRMHDPFAEFGNSHFGFPQFSTMGRRRAADPHEDDFFNRLPSEFRQYIPETFGHRRSTGSSAPQQPQSAGQGGQYFQYPTSPPNGVPPSPSKKVCDAAIQTEDPMGCTDAVDSAGPQPTDNLKQHGLRNTVDMGVKSATEGDAHGARSHSAPPNEQQQPQQQQYPQQQQQQQMPANSKHQTPPPQANQSQFGTQTSPHVQAGPGQQPQFQKTYYAPQNQPHPQQRQQASPPPPQTPGGTYVRTIPIFVEGRSEPIINSHKEIPVQSSEPGANASASASARAHAPHHQPHPQQQYYQQPHQQQQYHHPQQQHQQHSQQHRPTPLNTHTQQQPPQQQQQWQAGGQAAAGAGVPPQTPHTLDSINKIQDIQRDVLDLMGQVEQFTGTRKDKKYAYLDEMLTRNLLKLDTIDTQGKESIRLARKEAIKCIQASINVLEAKAEENARRLTGEQAPAAAETAASDNGETATQKSGSNNAVPTTAENAAPVDAPAATANSTDPQSAAEANKEPIPLPPPEGMQLDENASGEHPTDVNIVSNVSQNEKEATETISAEDAAKAATTESNGGSTSVETK